MKSTTPVMVGVALALLGCSSSDFNTPTLLNKPRILAIKADPAQPALGASTTLSALVYQPPPSADADAGAGADAGIGVIGYSWSWCPLATSSIDGFTCPIGQDAANQLFAGLGIVDAPPLDLGPGETATFKNPFPSALLANLCVYGLPATAGAPGAKFDCTIAGFPITINLVVHTTVAGEPKDLPAVFFVYLPINDAIPANLNPVVNGIDIFQHQLDQAGTQEVPRNSGVPVVLEMDVSSAEKLHDPNEVLPPSLYPPPDPKHPPLGPNIAPYEQLTLSWYAECGDFGANGLGGDRTGYLGDPSNLNSTIENAKQNTWNIPKREGCPLDYARMIVVFRDNRGGVTWTSGVAHVVDSLSDAGVSDALDAEDVAPDTGSPDSEAADSADAVLESAP
jgi:hypothetical protein